VISTVIAGAGTVAGTARVTDLDAAHGRAYCKLHVRGARCGGQAGHPKRPNGGHLRSHNVGIDGGPPYTDEVDRALRRRGERERRSGRTGLDRGTRQFPIGRLPQPWWLQIALPLIASRRRARGTAHRRTLWGHGCRSLSGHGWLRPSPRATFTIVATGGWQ